MVRWRARRRVRRLRWSRPPCRALPPSSGTRLRRKRATAQHDMHVDVTDVLADAALGRGQRARRRARRRRHRGGRQAGGGRRRRAVRGRVAEDGGGRAPGIAARQAGSGRGAGVRAFCSCSGSGSDPARARGELLLVAARARLRLLSRALRRRTCGCRRIDVRSLHAMEDDEVLAARQVRRSRRCSSTSPCVATVDVRASALRLGTVRDVHLRHGPRPLAARARRRRAAAHLQAVRHEAGPARAHVLTIFRAS